jgi:HlyD family secretion protein
MPRPPQRGGKRKDTSGGPKGTQKVWTLVDGQPNVLPVTIGLTDGSSTQILSGDLQPGMDLVVGEESGKK